MAQTSGLRIIIDGNIGSGKSQLMENLGRSFPNLLVTPEPISDWTSATNNQLKNLYDNPWQHTFAFQQEVLRHYRTLKEVNIQERSAISSYYVFGAYARSKGYVTSEEFDILRKQLHLTLQETKKPTAIFYLRAGVDTLLRRIKLRGRPEEAAITQEYLGGINYYYDDIYLKNPSSFNCPVFMLDAERSLSFTTRVTTEIIEDMIRQGAGEDHCSPLKLVWIPPNDEQPLGRWLNVGDSSSEESD